MIQFSKPRRSLAKSMDLFRRHETNARDYMNGAPNMLMDRAYLLSQLDAQILINRQPWLGIRGLPVALMRVFTAPMTLLVTSPPTSSLSAPRLHILLDFLCSVLLVHLDLVYLALPGVASEAHTATRRQSSHKMLAPVLRTTTAFWVAIELAV